VEPGRRTPLASQIPFLRSCILRHDAPYQSLAVSSPQFRRRKRIRWLFECLRAYPRIQLPNTGEHHRVSQWQQYDLGSTNELFIHMGHPNVAPLTLHDRLPNSLPSLSMITTFDIHLSHSDVLVCTFCESGKTGENGREAPTMWARQQHPINSTNSTSRSAIA